MMATKDFEFGDDSLSDGDSDLDLRLDEFGDEVLGSVGLRDDDLAIALNDAVVGEDDEEDSCGFDNKDYFTEEKEEGKVILTVSFLDYSFSLIVFLFSPLLVFVLTFFPAVLNTHLTFTCREIWRQTSTCSNMKF